MNVFGLAWRFDNASIDLLKINKSNQCTWHSVVYDELGMRYANLPGQPSVGTQITESLKILCGAQVAYLDHLTLLITDDPCRRNDEAAFWKLKMQAISLGVRGCTPKPRNGHLPISP
jgi:hypothetical protein